MLRVLEDLQANVLGVEAVGIVTEADYERVLIPAIRAKRDAHEKLRFLYLLGEEFDGWSMGALWEDTKLGLTSASAFEKIAVVSDNVSVHHAVKAFGWMIPGDVRVFDDDQLDDAKDWVAS
ncbi:MAG TPA: STAS/SEC14 domain-containing protein [Thermomicrobiales bacterium]|nr:STAS/SEC14 domain-containing protein [Thermomicrobiales bacterium]